MLNYGNEPNIYIIFTPFALLSICTSFCLLVELKKIIYIFKLDSYRNLYLEIMLILFNYIPTYKTIFDICKISIFVKLNMYECLKIVCWCMPKTDR